MGHPNVRITNGAGAFGSIYSAGTDPLTGPFNLIYANAAAVVDLSGGNMDGTVTTVAIPENGWVAGYFPTVTQASGTITAYYAQ